MPAVILFMILALSSCINTEYLKDIASQFNNAGFESDIDLYSYIENELLAGNTEFTVKNVSGDEVSRIYERVIGNHPELFWIGSLYSYETITNGRRISVNFNCTHSDSEGLDDKIILFNNVVNSVTAMAQNLGSDYEKALFVHDYIIDNTEYDSVIYDILMKDETHEYLYDAATAYGCLVNKKAICSGYAAAFQVIMQNLGIECGRVYGKKIGEGPHEWNYIMLDGDYYYVDVTWDDPVSQSGINTKTYQYFCVTTDDILETHIIDDDQEFIPVCTATEYNYYIYNNLYMEYYDFDSFSEIYLSHVNQNRISVKFSSEEELQAAKNDLITNQKIFEVTDGKRRCTYGVTGGGKVLEIIME